MKKIALTAPNGHFKNLFKFFASSDIVKDICYKVHVNGEETTVSFFPTKGDKISPNAFLKLISILEKY